MLATMAPSRRRVPSCCGITVSSIWSNPRESIFRGCRRDRASIPSSDARRSSRGCGMHPGWSSRTERGIGRRRTPWGCRRRGLFSSAEEYYSTLFHEPTHSTGHGSRVGREGIEQLNTFGSESYSREELIAEMGSAMLCGISGIETGTIENSAAHLAAWISRLRSDSRLLISAASAAQKAADYILGTAAEDGSAV